MQFAEASRCVNRASSWIVPYVRNTPGLDTWSSVLGMRGHLVAAGLEEEKGRTSQFPTGSQCGRSVDGLWPCQ